MSRTVVKWLQGLDLTYPIKNPKWDLSNGFLIAEIFSWYYPDDIRISAYNTGLSLDSKMTNWSLIKRFLTNKNLNIPLELIDETVHCKDGAAILLVENMFQLLTNRPIQKAQLDTEIDFSDWPYQQKLPYHARSTVSKSLKNNIRYTELNTDPNLNLNAGKAENIISNHVDHRKIERDLNPSRFSVKKTLAEKCVQRPVPETRVISDRSNYLNQIEPDQHDQAEKQRKASSKSASFKDDKVSSAEFKEIRVKQDVYILSLGTVN
jgi:hypothetical protein